MGRFKSTAIAAAFALSGIAAGNAPPPPPDREVPHDAVSTVHDTVAGLWEVRIESLVGPEAYPKTGTLDLTWSGRYFLNLTGSDGAATSEQGVWAVWEADEGGGFTLMLVPLAPGEGDMIDVEVEPHPDRIGGNQVIDFAGLKQFDLPVAGFGAERAHHHRRTPPEPPQHLGHGIDLFGTEGDDRAARPHARQLLRADVTQRGKARTADHFGLGQQSPHQRFERGGAEDHRLLAPARTQQPVGKDVTALAIGAELDFVDGKKRHLTV